MVDISHEQRVSLFKVTVESHPVQQLSAHILNPLNAQLNPSAICWHY
jgi:hypothetical protein